MMEATRAAVYRRICSRADAGVRALPLLLLSGLVVLFAVMVTPASAGAVTDSNGKYDGYTFSYDTDVPQVLCSPLAGIGSC